jgi:type IV secretion system protein VirD4
MQIWGIVQDLSQLKRIYGEGWQTFIGNSGVLQYFGSRDLMTAEYFSKLCGVTTVEKKTFSFSWTKGFSYAQGHNGNSSSESTTKNSSTDVVQRNLIYPDELMVLRDNKEIVFIENANPIPARKVEWFKNEEIRPFGVNLHQGPENPQPVLFEALPTPTPIEPASAPPQTGKQDFDFYMQKGADFITSLYEKLLELLNKWRGR